MTNKERQLILALTDGFLKRDRVTWQHANKILELRNAVEASAILAEAIADEAGKQIDTEIAATTVGISRVKIDDLFEAIRLFKYVAGQARTYTQSVNAVNKLREFCDHYRLPIDWTDYDGA